MTSRLIVNQIRHTGASADAITMDSSGNVTFPANATCSGTASGFGGGKILQVVQLVKTDTASITNNTTYTDISGISQAITISAGSKVLVTFDCHWSPNGGYSGFFRLVRVDTNGSTVYPYLGASSSSMTQASFGGFANSNSYDMQHSTMNYLDTPSGAGSHTYKIQWKTGYTNNGIYLGTDIQQSGSATRGTFPTSLTLMEVAA